MNIRLSSLVAAAALLLPSLHAVAADLVAPPPAPAAPALGAAPPGTAEAELKELVAKIQAKLKDGKDKESDLTEELKQFDVLLAKHKGEKTDDVAEILFMKGTLYLEVLDNDTKGAEILTQLKKDFPDTVPGKNADKILESVQQQAAAKKIQDALTVDTKFPDFDEKDVAGMPMSLANCKGKVVLVDFWATWCPPCVAEMPNVLQTYTKHHGEGFEILGISLDEEQAKLSTYTTENKITWQQYFDGKGWQNKLAGKYGVVSIPTSYLLDREGKIIAKGDDLRGEDLEAAVVKALAKK